ncbi:MAG: cupin domain-containing protein [Clostridiales bacterium]|nr:cupin domain-containing protein [Clostridiales bacterium]
MADPLLKNIPFEKVLELTSLVSYQEGQIVSRTLAQNKAVSVTLFAFDAGEEISTHASHGDAMVSVLDGTAQVTIGGNVHTVRAGQSIVMPAGVPHSVEAPEKFKMMLVVVFPAS